MGVDGDVVPCGNDGVFSGVVVGGDVVLGAVKYCEGGGGTGDGIVAGGVAAKDVVFEEEGDVGGFEAVRCDCYQGG